MITTKFEDTYLSVRTAKFHIKDLAEVVDFLSKQTKPLTCAEIGKGVFGADYSNSSKSRSYSSHLGQILKHLYTGGFITVEKRAGEPVIISKEVWVYEDSKGIPTIITVHDDEGNTYQIPNPKANQSQRYFSGKYKTVKKTIVPIIKFYKWAV